MRSSVKINQIKLNIISIMSKHKFFNNNFFNIRNNIFLHFLCCLNFPKPLYFLDSLKLFFLISSFQYLHILLKDL